MTIFIRFLQTRGFYLFSFKWDIFFVLPQISSLYEDFDGILDIDTILSCVTMTLLELIVIAFVCSCFCCSSFWEFDSSLLEICRGAFNEDFIPRHRKRCVFSKAANGSPTFFLGISFLFLFQKWPLGGLNLKILLPPIFQVVIVYLLIIPDVVIATFMKSSREQGSSTPNSWNRFLVVDLFQSNRSSFFHQLLRLIQLLCYISLDVILERFIFPLYYGLVASNHLGCVLEVVKRALTSWQSPPQELMKLLQGIFYHKYCDSRAQLWCFWYACLDQRFRRMFSSEGASLIRRGFNFPWSF